MNDLDYCYASQAILKKLEKVVYSRNESIRQFKKRQHNRSAIVCSCIALFLPLVIWIKLFFFTKNNVSIFIDSSYGIKVFIMRILSLMMISLVMFTLSYFILLNFWQKTSTPVKTWVEKSLRVSLINEINDIDIVSQAILSEKVLSHPRVPDEYLTPEMLLLLVRYFKTGQVITIREALYALDLEMKNTGHYDSLIMTDTLLRKEQRYFLKEKENLVNQIIMEGKT